MAGEEHHVALHAVVGTISLKMNAATWGSRRAAAAPCPGCTTARSPEVLATLMAYLMCAFSALRATTGTMANADADRAPAFKQPSSCPAL